MTSNTPNYIKILSLCLLALSFTQLSYSQNALAKIEYAEAETDFQAGNYQESLAHLETVKEMLGSTNAKVMYLEILSKDRIVKEDLSSQLPNSQTFEHLKSAYDLSGIYIESFEASSILEKLKEIYKIHQEYETHITGIETYIEAFKRYENNDLTKAQELARAACDGGNKFGCQGFDKIIKDKKNNEQLVDVLNNIKNNMVLVEGGSFIMGTRQVWINVVFLDHTEHRVTIDSYYINKYEFSLYDYYVITGENSRNVDFSNVNKRIPLTGLSYYQIVEFIEKLNQLTNMKYRLPTEAEWEYAAMGGKNDRGYRFAGSDKSKEVAYFRNNSGNRIHPSGELAPNQLGLYDMSGNVSEWCSDWFSREYFSNSPSQNPKGPIQDTGKKVHRGGYFELNIMGKTGRLKRKFQADPNVASTIIGFRLAMDTN